MTQPEYTGADRACDCDPPNICEILAELRAMKDRIENMIVSVQGLPGDHAGNVQLPFAEDIGDSTLGVSGTFAGGHAVLQVKGIADNADETARNAQDIAQIAADAANSASQSATTAYDTAAAADRRAMQAMAEAGLALSTAEDAQAAVGNSVMVIGPSVAEETQVRVPYLLKDGTQGAFLVPAVDPDSAGVITPGQMADLGHQLDSLGGEIDGVKAEYLRRHDIHNEQDITGRVAFKISPFVPVLKSNEYTDHDGTRALNAKSAEQHPLLVNTNKAQSISGLKSFTGPGLPFDIQPYGMYDLFSLLKIMNATVPYKAHMFEKNLSPVITGTCLSDNSYDRAEFTAPDVTTENAFIWGIGCFNGCKMSKITSKSGGLMVLWHATAGCNSLATLDLKALSYVSFGAFENSGLTDLIIRTMNKTPTLDNKNAFYNTPIENGTGSVYVPDDKVAEMKQATNWSQFASQIKGLSALPPELKGE